jgi:YggT family protein
MFVLANLLVALAQVLYAVLNIYMIVVFVAVLISWVNPDPYNPIVRFLYSVTEPVFAFVRRRLPLPAMPLDISPMIVLFGIYFLQYFLVPTMMDLARSLR